MGWGGIRRTRTGLVESRVNERRQPKGKEQNFQVRGEKAGYKDFRGLQREQIHMWLLKITVSRSLEDGLDWKRGPVASGKRVDASGKLPKVSLRQWWASGRVERGATFSRAD